ncbi:hypothetical protein ACSBR2_012787 [Camellia fascicularis]
MEFVKVLLSCLLHQEFRRSSMGDVVGSLQLALQLQESWENRIKIGVELPMTDPSSSNFFFTDGEFTIGGVSFLPSDFDEGWREESMSDSDSKSDE